MIEKVLEIKKLQKAPVVPNVTLITFKDDYTVLNIGVAGSNAVKKITAIQPAYNGVPLVRELVCDSDNVLHSFYDRLCKGAYGQVFQASDQKGDVNYAIKEFFNQNVEEFNSKNIPIWLYGIPRSLYQEVIVMKELRSKHILNLYKVYIENNTVSIVMPLIQHDLKKILVSRVRLTEAQIKGVMLGILEGLDHMHSHCFLHRDLSPANIFITNDGEVQIADYGMAVNFGTTRKFSLKEEVVTLWYRAPELLFKAPQYMDKIDVWAFGCIFAETLLGGIPLFNGANRDEQLAKIFNIRGTPNCKNCPDNEWPDVSCLPEFTEFEHRVPVDLSTLIPNCSPLALDLLYKTTLINPTKRLSVKDALAHPWFSTPPLSERLVDLFFQGIN